MNFCDEHGFVGWATTSTTSPDLRPGIPVAFTQLLDAIISANIKATLTA